MKKKLLLSTLFLLFFIKGYSQKDLAFEIKGGVNFSEMKSEGFLKNEGRTGYHLGAFASFPLVNKFSLETGVGYSTQGGKAELSTNVGRARMKLDYLQLPVMLKLEVFPKMSLSAGTYLNFLVNEEISFEYKDGFMYSFLPTGPREVQFEANNFEVSASLGLQYALFPSFSLYTTFIQGVTGAVEFEESAVKVRNRTYLIGLGYRF